MRAQKDWIKSISWQTNHLIFSPLIFSFWCGLIGKRRGDEAYASLFKFEKVQAVHAPLELVVRKERGTPPLCFGMEKERERVNTPSLVCIKILRGAKGWHPLFLPPLAPSLLALWDEGVWCPLFLPYGMRAPPHLA